MLTFSSLGRPENLEYSHHSVLQRPCLLWRSVWNWLRSLRGGITTFSDKKHPVSQDLIISNALLFMLNTAASSLPVYGGLQSAFHRYYPIWVAATLGGTGGEEGGEKQVWILIPSLQARKPDREAHWLNEDGITAVIWQSVSFLLYPMSSINTDSQLWQLIYMSAWSDQEVPRLNIIAGCVWEGVSKWD